jgi:hypothetical protein
MRIINNEKIFAIIVPSHISNEERIGYFIECIDTLINQIYKVDIYISISFTTNNFKQIFMEQIKKKDMANIIIDYTETPYSQFRHIDRIFNKYVKDRYEYVMFIDNDDIYERRRTLIFRRAYESYKEQQNKILAGIYESEKYDHSEIQLEYWQYAIKNNILGNFLQIIKDTNVNILDNKLCDLLLGYYMRHMDERHIFIRLHTTAYGYRTGQQNSVLTDMEKYNINVEKTMKTYKTLHEHIENINDMIKNNIEIINTNIITYILENRTKEEMWKLILNTNIKYKNEIKKELVREIERRYYEMRILTYKLNGWK